MTDDEAQANTPADGGYETEVLGDEANEELQRLHASLGLAAHAPRRIVDGRYEVRGRRGQGGMGVVYRVHDLRLDRDVALKLVRSRPFRDEDRLHDRLEREAKALAKLETHPHVVGVYELGRHHDRIYFTMPFIEGPDLREWQDSGSRDLDELLDVYLQAARGLAAAHALGVIHRDFKPSNVLIREQDRHAFVADFGIAEAVSKLDTPAGGVDVGEVDDLVRLTATGAVLGTLPYIAPERLPARGHPPVRGDPSSDQFSFCVALWEAIAGEVPFPADSSAAFLVAVESEPRAEKEVPGWLRVPLRRGLDRDPDARYASMDELIAMIERRRHRKRRLLTAGTVLVSLVLIALSVANIWQRIVPRTAATRPCSTFADSAATVWNDARRERLLERRTLAPETYDHVIDQFDALILRWVTAGERTCTEGGAPPPDDERVACLERWLYAADASLALISAVDEPRIAAGAGDVVDRLVPPPGGFCAIKPPPIVDLQLWHTTDLARAAAVLGADARARELSEQALARARALAGSRIYTAEYAEAYAARAEVLARGGDYVAARAAFEEADLHADLSDHLALELSNQALWAKVRAIDGDALDQGKAIEDVTRKLRFVPALSSDEQRTQLAAELEDAAGFVEYRRDAYPAARAHHERARELLAGLDQPVLMAKILINLGADLQMLDQLDEAESAYETARQTLAAAGISPAHATALDADLHLGILAVELDRSSGFDHLHRVARFSSGPRQLQALDQALTLAVNLGEEARMRELADELLRRCPTPTSPLEFRARFDAATALVRLGDARGGKLFASLERLDSEVIPPRLGLGLRRSHVRALEDRQRCEDAADALERVDAFARAHNLVDGGFRAWRSNRETADCALSPFMDQ